MAIRRRRRIGELGHPGAERAGPATAAAALQCAAALTSAPGERGRRLVSAAEASWTAGRHAQALSLLDQAEPPVSESTSRAGPCKS